MVALYALIFLIISISCCLILLKIGYHHKSANGKSTKHLPGPIAVPFIGHLHLIGAKSLHVVLKELSSVYGSVYHLKLGSRKAVVLSDRDAVYEAFVKKAKDFAGRPNLPTFEYTRQGRTGISLCDYGEGFLSNRKKSVRAIHHLLADKDNLNEILTTEAEKMTRDFDQLVQTQTPFNPLAEFQKIVPSMFMLLMFGQNVSYDDPEFLNIVSIYRQWFEAAEADNPADFFNFLRFFPNKRLSIIESCGKAFEEFNLKMIEMNEKDNNNNNVKERKSLLNHLIDESDISTKNDKQELAKVVSDLVGGGFDTSVAFLSWSLLYLARQPEVLKKCQTEINKATGGTHLSVDIKDNCPYFSACIHEINRLTTVAPTGLVHTATKDTSLKGFFIPKGTLVMPNLWQVNHDPRYWNTPEQLNPEHFLTNDGGLNNKAVMDIASFSFGIRRCPASSIAFSMIFVLLGTFITKYNITLVKSPEDMQPLRGVTSKPKPYLLTISKI